jgi:phenylalanyl-tRNA synthetase beta chain
MLSGAIASRAIKGEVFYELKGAVESLFNSLGISDVWYDDYRPTPEDSAIGVWHKGKCAEIKSGGKEIGFLGEINPLIGEKLGITEKVYAFDLDFEALRKLATEEQEYQPLSVYPPSVRDIAVLVPRGTKAADILNVIYSTGGKTVRDVDVFDIYEGKELPENKINFAFHIIYQSDKKTLNSKEVDALHQKIINALENVPQWEVRK